MVGLAAVDIFGCQHGDAGVPVLGVVPDKERPAKGDSVLDRAEPIGKARVILEGLELGFGEGIIVGDARPRERLRDTKPYEESSGVLGGHRRAPITV